MSVGRADGYIIGRVMSSSLHVVPCVWTARPGLGLQLSHFLMGVLGKVCLSVGLSSVLNRMEIILGLTSDVVVGIEMMYTKYLEHTTG